MPGWEADAVFMDAQTSRHWLLPKSQTLPITAPPFLLCDFFLKIVLVVYAALFNLLFIRRREVKVPCKLLRGEKLFFTLTDVPALDHESPTSKKGTRFDLGFT